MRQDDLSAALRAAEAAERPDPTVEVGLSVVIPMLNEEASVGPLLERLARVLDRLALVSEVILIDDGSRDGTAALLERAAAKDRRLRVILFRRNYGQTAAMMAGIDHARGRIIVPMDGDLQNDPADIPALIAKLEEDYDVVSGWRQERQDHTIRLVTCRRVANRLISLISGVHLHDYGCSLKAYRPKYSRTSGSTARCIASCRSMLPGRAPGDRDPGRHHAREHGSRNTAWAHRQGRARPDRGEIPVPL